MTRRGIGKLPMIIAVLLVVSAIFSVNIYAAAPLSDIGNHWAKEQVSYLAGKDIISGYPDNTFKPQNDVTRAEFYRIINGVIGYTELAEINYADVKKGEWYYDEVAKGVKAGYIFEKSGGNIQPNKAITREEVARIMSVTFGLTENAKAAAKFSDAGQMADWAKGHIGALQEKKFILGYPDNTFKPQGKITRAEAATMIKNASGEIVNQKGEYKYEVKGNLLVNTKDVTLKDTVIKGDLYLAEGIANGDVTLDNVTVEGETVIRGGGENSIIIKNSKLQNIVANKSVGKVRIVIEGKVDVPRIDIQNNTILVIRDGVTVASIVINGQADIQVAKGATVKAIEANAPGAVIDSQGTIELVKATEAVKLNGSDVAKGNETKVIDGKTTQPATPPSSGGGGGGGGGGSSTPVSANPDASKIFVRYFDGHIYNYQFKEYAMKKDTKISVYESNSASKSLYSFVVSEDQEGKTGSFGFTKLYDKAPGEQLFISITEPNKRESNRLAVKVQGYPLKDEQTNLEKYEVNVTKDNDKFVITAKGNWDPKTGIGNAYRLNVEIKHADSSTEQFVRTLINGQNTNFEYPANDAEEVKITITELGYRSSDVEVFPFEVPEPVVDKSELETVIAQALELEETDYTEESWLALQAALTAAQEVVADDEASQEDVDDAKAALETAISELVEKTPEPVVDKEVRSIEPTVISVVYGTPKEDIGLPSQVTLVLDDESEVQADVTWDEGTPEYDGYEAGDYEFAGTITLPENVLNSDNVKATAKVTVEEATSGDVNVNDVSINESDKELKVGETLQLTATITPANATNQDVIWQSSNAAVATVDDNGLVTAVAEGEVTITVTTEDGNKTDSVVITVVDIIIKGELVGAEEYSGYANWSAAITEEGIDFGQITQDQAIKMGIADPDNYGIALDLKVGGEIVELNSANLTKVERVKPDGTVESPLVTDSGTVQFIHDGWGETGEYTMRYTLTDGNVVEANITVVSFEFKSGEPVEPVKSEYGFVVPSDELKIVAGDLPSQQPSETNIEIDDMEPLKITLKATEVKDEGYDFVRILVETETAPQDGTIQAWIEAKSATDSNWYNVIKTGWGGTTEESKSSLANDENTTLDVYVFADTAGEYQVTFKAVDMRNSNAEIAQGTVTIIVEEVVQPEAAIEPVGAGVSHNSEEHLSGNVTFTFAFQSVTGSLQELELDMYLGDDAGKNRDYNNHIGINLPADSDELTTAIETLVNNKENLKQGLQTILKAVANKNDLDEIDTDSLQGRVTYAVDNNEGTGTWTLMLNVDLLETDVLEFLVAVRDDQGAQWGQNNYTVNNGDDTKVFLYQIDRPAVPSIATEEELTDAIESAEDSSIITLTGDIKLTTTLMIRKGNITIDGAGHSITGPESDHGIAIEVADNVTLKNLTVKDSGKYNVQYYRSKGGKLEDVKLVGAKSSGLYVNGSEVEVENIETIENNWGGIEVSQGVNVSDIPKLTVTGTHTHENVNDGSQPAIWIDGKKTNDDWVSYEEEQYEENVPEDKNQLWFTLK